APSTEPQYAFRWDALPPRDRTAASGRAPKRSLSRRSSGPPAANAVRNSPWSRPSMLSLARFIPAMTPNSGVRAQAFEASDSATSARHHDRTRRMRPPPSSEVVEVANILCAGSGVMRLACKRSGHRGGSRWPRGGPCLVATSSQHEELRSHRLGADSASNEVDAGVNTRARIVGAVPGERMAARALDAGGDATHEPSAQVVHADGGGARRRDGVADGRRRAKRVRLRREELRTGQCG